MTIDVRAGDISAAMRKRKATGVTTAWDCPIAFAAGRVFKQRVAIPGEFIMLLKSYDVVELPQVVQDWIKKFDEAPKSVEPFSFEVAVVDA